MCPRPLRALGLPAVLALVLAAGCISADVETSGTVAASAGHGGGLATASTSAPDCAGKTLVEDNQLLLQGGRGGHDFLLERPCALKASLEVREAAGTLTVRVEGPEGTLFQRSLHGFFGPLWTVSIGSTGGRSTEAGPSPAGTYHYTFEADAVADFGFRVETAS